VPPHYLGHRPAERVDVERAREAYAAGMLYAGLPGSSRSRKPQPLLGEGERQVAIARDGRWALLSLLRRLPAQPQHEEGALLGGEMGEPRLPRRRGGAGAAAFVVGRIFISLLNLYAKKTVGE